MSQRIQQERSLFVLLRVNFCRMQLTYPATPPHLQAWNLLSHSHLACLHLQTFFFKFIYKYYFLVAYKETLFLIKQSSFLFRLRCFFLSSWYFVLVSVYMNIIQNRIPFCFAVTLNLSKIHFCHVCLDPM